MATVQTGSVVWPSYATMNCEDNFKSACKNRRTTLALIVFGVFLLYPGAKTADSSRTELTSAPQFSRMTPNLRQPLDNGTSSSLKEKWVQGYQQEGYDGRVSMLD